MITVYKFPLQMVQSFSLKLPEGAEILSCQAQFNQPVIWAKVDTEAKTEVRNFLMYDTGHEIVADNLKHIDTFQTYDGNYVYHLFEEL